ncbi:hypothetical protein [Microbispora triticiradicis]|uniref:hypothetical protein n=1 Tax=Microbispora triticiradicis TaxID=2200763 RepID=UPI00140485C6|nr:hypothetical protein [Microbispora triticiradicis]
MSATANTVLFVPTAVGMAFCAGLLALTSYRPVLYAAAIAVACGLRPGLLRSD